MAEHKRLTVMRRIADVLEHPTGPRLYTSMTESRSVHREITWLVDHRMVEPCDRGGDRGYRLTSAGEMRLRHE